jgi:hypothetical protein
MYMVHCTISNQKLNDYKTHINFLETSCAICTTACAFILTSRENIIIPVPVIESNVLTGLIVLIVLIYC